MNPKSLTGFSHITGSTISIRLAVAFITLVWLSVTHSIISMPDFGWETVPGILFANVPVAGFVYMLTKFSNIFYTEDSVIIHSFRGKVTYSKSDFFDIRTVSSFFSWYRISFRDGREFLFGEPSRYLSLDNDTTSKVEDMKKKLLR